MPGGAFFSVRRKSRWQRGRRPAKKMFILLSLVLLATGIARYINQPVLPAMAGPSAAARVFSFIPERDKLFLKLLSQVIPGIVQPAAVAGEAAALPAKDDLALQAVSRLDPRDPKRIIAAQIPYMSEVSPTPQPLLYRVNAGGDMQDGPPRIVIPTRTAPGGGEKILIYHTHTTESFLPTTGKNFTDDLTQTVAALGAELAAILAETYRIPVVHNQQIHDIPRSTSYETALPTIRKLLAENPDTKLLIDLHRDGVDKKISTAVIDGEPVGRILFVVGTRHANWQENYERALCLHEALEAMAPGLSRGVRERPLVYNQHVHPGALLIEVGGHENSLAEAQRTLPYLARALAALYSE